MVELILWIVAIWALVFAACATFRAALGRRWKRLAAWGVVPAVVLAFVLVYFAPPINGYNDLAASYWMSRAAAEQDAVEKEALVRRVALTAPEHGWFTAGRAITTVEDAIQRCRLRTLLAGLPGVQNRERLGNEARDECNAILKAKG